VLFSREPLKKHELQLLPSFSLSLSQLLMQTGQGKQRPRANNQTDKQMQSKHCERSKQTNKRSQQQRSIGRVSFK